MKENLRTEVIDHIITTSRRNPDEFRGYLEDKITFDHLAAFHARIETECLQRGLVYDDNQLAQVVMTLAGNIHFPLTLQRAKSATNYDSTFVSPFYSSLLTEEEGMLDRVEEKFRLQIGAEAGLFFKLPNRLGEMSYIAATLRLPLKYKASNDDESSLYDLMRFPGKHKPEILEKVIEIYFLTGAESYARTLHQEMGIFKQRAEAIRRLGYNIGETCAQTEKIFLFDYYIQTPDMASVRKAVDDHKKYYFRDIFKE